MQGIETILERQGTIPIAVLRRLLEFGAQARRDIGRDRNAALPSHRVESQRRFVIAGKLAEIGPAGEPLRGDPPQIPGGVLDADNGLELLRQAVEDRKSTRLNSSH